MSSDLYDYTIVETVSADQTKSYTIDLLQVQTGKIKSFYMAGSRSMNALHNHMKSLTDDLCSQWFNVREPKKKKEKKDE